MWGGKKDCKEDELLKRVGIKLGQRVLDNGPHELSLEDAAALRGAWVGVCLGAKLFYLGAPGAGAGLSSIWHSGGVCGEMMRSQRKEA